MSAAESNETTPRRANVAQAIAWAIRDVYSHLGGIIAISIGWSLGVASTLLGAAKLSQMLAARNAPPAVPELVFLAIVVGIWVAIGGPLLAGIYRWARNVAAREDHDLLDCLWGVRQAWGRSSAIAAAQALGFIVLIANVLFYLYLSLSPNERARPWATVLWILFAYVLLFWQLCTLYQWPLLAEQNRSVADTLKKSFLLAIDNFFYSAVVALAGAVLGIVLAITGIGAVLIATGWFVLLHTQAMRGLLRRYGLIAHPEPPGDEPVADAWGHGWHE